ncbi:MAG: prephenate dehydrogenase [Clostridia bacterium]|nr:prephenate dehydrogenase [Clostridia bacterium]MBQ4624151.1 prephenate dehydrogenase [Clostridia bacterium]
MEWNLNHKILIVGLGLMGGSYAQALKRLGFTVEAIDVRPEGIAYATEHGIIDRGYTEVTKEAVESADVVIFSLYPGVFKEWIEKYQGYFHPGTILTDVTGVKSCVVYDIQAMLRPDVEFIAAHPMAGREVYGVEHSDDRIFRDANYIVTPTEKNTQEAIEWCKRLGRFLGFRRISVLSPEEHDRVIGFVSQLTHVIAVSLMTCNDYRELAAYTGDSFRDLTRIARINENMWSELFLLNKPVLLEQMDLFMKELAEIRTLMEQNNEEGLKEKMRLSTARRAYFDK